MTTSVYDALMSHDVVIRKFGLSPTGDEIVLDSWNEKGFIEYDRHRAVDEKNEEITCDARAYLKNDSHFDPKHDRWAITDVKNDNTMNIKAFRVIDDPRTGETHHFEFSIL